MTKLITLKEDATLPIPSVMALRPSADFDRSIFLYCGIWFTATRTVEPRPKRIRGKLRVSKWSRQPKDAMLLFLLKA